MFNIGIDAIILHIGSFEVRWYLITEILAIVAFVSFAFIESKRLNISRRHLPWLILTIVVAGIILAKLTDVIGRPGYYFSQPEKVFNPAGMRLAGLLIGAFVAKLLYSWWTKISFWRVSDLFVPGVVLAMAIFRAGCFVNGCCFGLECSMPWMAVTYSGASTIAPANIPLYPVQLYQVLLNLLIFGIIWSYRKRLQPQGATYLLYVILFAAGDFIIRLFRQPDAVFLGIQIQQYLNLMMLMVSVPLLVLRYRRWFLRYQVANLFTTEK